MVKILDALCGNSTLFSYKGYSMQNAVSSIATKGTIECVLECELDYSITDGDLLETFC
jgi:hypothetical protein